MGISFKCVFCEYKKEDVRIKASNWFWELDPNHCMVSLEGLVNDFLLLIFFCLARKPWEQGCEIHSHIHPETIFTISSKRLCRCLFSSSCHLRLMPGSWLTVTLVQWYTEFSNKENKGVVSHCLNTDVLDLLYHYLWCFYLFSLASTPSFSDIFLCRIG